MFVYPEELAGYFASLRDSLTRFRLAYSATLKTEPALVRQDGKDALLQIGADFKKALAEMPRDMPDLLKRIKALMDSYEQVRDLTYPRTSAQPQRESLESDELEVLASQVQIDHLETLESLHDHVNDLEVRLRLHRLMEYCVIEYRSLVRLVLEKPTT